MPIEERSPASLRSESLRRSLQVLFDASSRHRSLLLRVAAVTAVLGFSIALIVPNRYSATVVILPPQQGGSAGAALLSQLGSLGGMASLGGGGMGIKNPNDLQVSLLKSEPVEDAVIRHYHLDQLYHCKYLSQTRRHWEQLTHVDNGLKDGLIRITVEDRDAGRAAELANGWVNEYRHFFSTLAVTEASQRRLFFEQQLNNARTDLTLSEEALQQTEQRTGIIQMDGQAHAMIESAAVLRGQITAKQVEIRGMQEFAAPQNPDLVRVQQELSSLEGQLSQMDVGSKGRSGDLVAPKGLMTEAGLEYARALREAKSRETVYELLARQYEVARVDEAREGTPVQIVAAAAVPDRPSSAIRIWILLGSVLGAFPIGLLVALVAEGVAIARREREHAGSWSAAFQSEWAGDAR